MDRLFERARRQGQGESKGDWKLLLHMDFLLSLSPFMGGPPREAWVFGVSKEAGRTAAAVRPLPARPCFLSSSFCSSFLSLSLSLSRHILSPANYETGAEKHVRHFFPYKKEWDKASFIPVSSSPSHGRRLLARTIFFLSFSSLLWSRKSQFSSKWDVKSDVTCDFHSTAVDAVRYILYWPQWTCVLEKGRDWESTEPVINAQTPASQSVKN